MRAGRWSPEPLTRAVYEQAAYDLVGPLLTRYNRVHGTRHRLSIDTRVSKPFKVSPRTQTLFDSFLGLANLGGLHSLDWQRFYLLARDSRQEIPEHILSAKLEEAGFAPAKSRELAELYAHLWGFKRLR